MGGGRKRKRSETETRESGHVTTRQAASTVAPPPITFCIHDRHARMTSRYFTYVPVRVCVCVCEREREGCMSSRVSLVQAGVCLAACPVRRPSPGFIPPSPSLPASPPNVVGAWEKVNCWVLPTSVGTSRGMCFAFFAFFSLCQHSPIP